jgi:hypothetical protein
MGATNSTLNYQLSQFVATDKPAWLQDYNGDMEKIDVGINTAKVAADTAQNTANSAVSSIGTVSSDISALQTDVLAHTNDITDLQGDVNTIESLIGNGTPTAGDHTLIGAINTNTADIANVNLALTFQHAGTWTNSSHLDIAIPSGAKFVYITGTTNQGATGSISGLFRCDVDSAYNIANVGDQYISFQVYQGKLSYLGNATSAPNLNADIFFVKFPIVTS